MCIKKLEENQCKEGICKKTISENSCFVYFCCLENDSWKFQYFLFCMQRLLPILFLYLFRDLFLFFFTKEGALRTRTLRTRQKSGHKKILKCQCLGLCVRRWKLVGGGLVGLGVCVCEKLCIRLQRFQLF